MVNSIPTTSDSPTAENRPLWVDSEAQTFPSVDSDMSVDVAVIGGGIAGVGAARWLSQSGSSNIAVFEARTVSAGASGRNAGFVMSVAPENFPKTDDANERDIARAMWSFTAENQRLLEATAQEFQIQCEYRKAGSLGLAASHREWDWIHASTEIARDAGLQVSIVDRADLRTPWLRENYFGGAWYMDNAEIHPGKFIRGLARALSERYVRFFERSPITKITAGSSGVELEAGEYRVTAQRVIVATNAYTATLLPVTGAHIAPTRGQVLATAPLSRTVAECPVYANEGFQYWHQTASGRLLVGGWRNTDMATEVGTIETLNAAIQAELDRATFGICGADVPIEYRWSGIMGFTPDHRPLVGFIPELPDVVVAAGYSGHGLAMALHASKCAVDILLGQDCAMAGLFNPTRFDRQPPSHR